jgi:hypothetical protein
MTCPPLTDDLSAIILTEAIDALAALRTPAWLGDCAVHLHTLTSPIPQAQQLPTAVAATRDQDHTWAQIGQLLNLPRAQQHAATEENQHQLDEDHRHNAAVRAGRESAADRCDDATTDGWPEHARCHGVGNEARLNAVWSKRVIRASISHNTLSAMTSVVDGVAFRHWYTAEANAAARASTATPSKARRVGCNIGQSVTVSQRFRPPVELSCSVFHDSH